MNEEADGEGEGDVEGGVVELLLFVLSAVVSIL